MTLSMEEIAAVEAAGITETGWRVLDWLSETPMTRKELHERRAREHADWDETVEAVNQFLSLCILRENGSDYEITDYGYAIMEARP